LIRIPAGAVVNSQPLTPGLATTLRREILDFGPDLVHLHLPNPLAALAWLTLEAWPGLACPPLAVWYHADITRQRLGRLAVAPLVRAILRRAAGVSVSSAALRETSPFLRRHADRTRVIPFGIDPLPWAGVDPACDGPFLFVGRLVPYKGLDVLLEAVARVPEAEIVLVGEGPLTDEIHARSARPDLAGRVRLAGPLDRSGLAGLMERARAMVLPSVDRSETFGLVQLEAMAAGLPVVVSELETGIARVGEPGVTGLAVPPGDPAALAAALARFQDDPALARTMGGAGRRHFTSRYTRGTMIDGLLAWYAELLGAEVSA
jgi:rhamnosyl/mannosyltransferase